jgi:hypothetical protein
MPDQNGGSGPYLTKDHFYEWKDEYHLQQLKNEKQRAADKQDILDAIEKSTIKVSEGCKDDSKRNEKRIENIEGQLQIGKILGSVITAGLTAIGLLK